MLEKISDILDYKSVFFQEIFLHSFNEFEIKLFLVQESLFECTKINSFSKKNIEILFIQFIIINDFIIDNKINFIDLEKFSIIENEGVYVVKFKIQLFEENSGNGTKKIIDLFKRHHNFSDLSQKNIREKFKALMDSQIMKDSFYIYKYKDFSSNFLNLYNFENIRNSSNTIIKINTVNKHINKIIKLALYSGVYSNNFLFFNIDEGIKSVLDHIIKKNPLLFNSKKYDFLEVINKFEKYILQSSIRSVIFFLDRKITVEEENFFKYLLNMTKLKNVILLSFGIGINATFDLELNEKPKNYYYINTVYPEKESDSLGIESSDEKLEANYKYTELLSKFEAGNIDVTVDEKLIEDLIDMLIAEEKLSLAENVLDKIDGNSVLALLKTAQIYRIRREYKKIGGILKKLPENIPENYKCEFNYLSFYFIDRFGNSKDSDVFLSKIKDPYYTNLANIHISDRLIKKGELEKTFSKLLKSKEYFKKYEYKIEELETDGQIAKYYREAGDKEKSEYLYKFAFFYGELNNYLLLSASLALDLGNLFYSIDDFNQAEFWYKKAFIRYEKVKNRNGEDLCEFNLSEIYKINGEWDKAKELLEKALAHDKKDKREESIAIDSYNIAHLEYLKNIIDKSLKYCDLAIESFDIKGILSGVIETVLLSLRIRFFSLSESDINNFEQNYLKKCNNNQRVVFTVLKNVFNNSGSKSIISKIESISSARLKFEMAVFYIHISGSKKAFKILKGITALLSKKNKNYFFYEYHYLYFNYFLNENEIENTEKSLFLEVYYFFLKNGRVVSQNIEKLKKSLEQNKILNDLMENAKGVEEYKDWKTPSDFFSSFLIEIKKLLNAEYICLNIYINKKELFSFANKTDYKELSNEMIDKSIRDLSSLSLSAEDIKKMKCKGKLFYPYDVTEIIPWKISETLFSVLILGFKESSSKKFDIYSENKSFFVRYASLFSDFYSRQFMNRAKMSFIIGISKPIELIKKKIIKLSSNDFSILISGESGTGKELIAKAIHNLSRRNNKPFVPVNIAAIPESLIEAELFGARKGAFTGANEDRVGLIESADKGTLFLDEIGEIPINLQAKLLRALESGEVRRLGENKIRMIDIRVLSATNRNLIEMTKNGSFREDLFYRIAGLEIKSPPLRERMQDIPLLAKYFLKKYKFEIEDEAEVQNIINYLIKFRYMGNIRELQSKIKEVITYYPDYNDYNDEKTKESSPDSGLFELRDIFEKSIIVKALNKNKNSKQLTAKELKISRMHLSKLIKKHNIS